MNLINKFLLLAFTSIALLPFHDASAGLLKKKHKKSHKQPEVFGVRQNVWDTLSEEQHTEIIVSFNDQRRQELAESNRCLDARICCLQDENHRLNLHIARLERRNAELEFLLRCSHDRPRRLCPPPCRQFPGGGVR